MERNLLMCALIWPFCSRSAFYPCQNHRPALPDVPPSKHMAPLRLMKQVVNVHLHQHIPFETDEREK